jgi:hypothetical protein
MIQLRKRPKAREVRRRDPIKYHLLAIDAARHCQFLSIALPFSDRDQAGSVHDLQDRAGSLRRIAPHLETRITGRAGVASKAKK